MLHIQKYLVILVFALSFVSCKDNDDAHCPVINLGEAQEITEQELFSKVEVIPLQNKGDIILSNISQMVVSDQYLLVKDSRNIIYVYTKDGALVSTSLRKIGNGTGEYSVVTAFGFNRHTKNIEVLTPQNLLCYNVHFDFIKKVQLPTKWSNTGNGMLFFGQIYDLSKERHVLVPTSISKDCDKMFIFNSANSKVEKELDFSDGFIAGVNMQEQCFFDNSSKDLGIVPPFVTGYLYALDKTNLELFKAYKVVNGKKGLLASDLVNMENDEEKLQRFLMSTEKEIPISALETQKHISFIVKKGSDLKKWFMLFYDKSSGMVGRINCYSNNKAGFPIVKNADNTCLYAVVEQNDLAEIISHLSKSKIKIAYGKVCKSDYYVLKSTFK